MTISTHTPIACRRADGVEDRLEPAAELAIAAIVEALEVDLVEIDVRPEVLEHLRRAVAVRHEPGHQARRARLLEDGDGPLGRDERLVVGADDDPRALVERAARTSAFGVAACGGATASGSRSACDVTQFWQ